MCAAYLGRIGRQLLLGPRQIENLPEYVSGFKESCRNLRYSVPHFPRNAFNIIELIFVQIIFPLTYGSVVDRFLRIRIAERSAIGERFGVGKAGMIQQLRLPRNVEEGAYFWKSRRALFH